MAKFIAKTTIINQSLKTLYGAGAKYKCSKYHPIYAHSLHEGIYNEDAHQITKCQFLTVFSSFPDGYAQPYGKQQKYVLFPLN